MVDKNDECPICKSKEVKKTLKNDPLSIIVSCPVCGRYEFDFEAEGSIASTTCSGTPSIIPKGQKNQPEQKSEK